MSFKKWRSYAFIIISFCLVQPVEAWRSHLLLTAPVVISMQGMDQPFVPAETLSSFLEAESEGLVSLFKNIDSWPNQVGSFPALPPALIFKGKQDTQRTLVQQFTDRARIHPQGESDMHYDTLFVQYGPYQQHRIHNPLHLSEIVLSSVINETSITNLPLERVIPGEFVSPFEIITSAVDEPDFGMDINLFEDNNTDFGKKYKLGYTPGFVNKDLSIATQAPFHIGWYHEDFVVRKLGPDLTAMYPEYRIHFFLTLSQYAFKTGHMYWGYRFLGWALHYQQDLAQPYHAKLVPGISAINLPFANQTAVKNRVTNLHLALENYQYNLMRQPFVAISISNILNNPFLIALTDRSKDNYKIQYNDLYPRDVVALESYYHAEAIDYSLVTVFGKLANTMTNSNDGMSQNASMLNFDSIDLDLYAKTNQADSDVQELNRNLIGLFESVGVHTRKLILYALDSRYWPDKQL